ncbi:MAG: Ig-like domain-containing protein [Marinicellaceae bacterium]
MRLKYFIVTMISIVILQACSSSSNAPSAVAAPPATNPGGDPATATITAIFDPSNGVLPFPSNLLLSGTTDLTLNIPVADPTNFGDPAVALSALDGFSTNAPWATSFSSNVAPASVTPGNSVRLFEVELSGPGGGVTGIVRELTPGADFVAVSTGAGIAVIPTKALEQITSYMAVLTNGITDTAGNAATPDQTYFLAQRTSPLVDANGNSTDPLIPNSTAQALEPLRQLTNSQEFAAASAGVDRRDIVLSWTMTTQSVSPVLSAVKAISGPGASTLVPSGLTTSVAGGAGIADIWVGVQSSPYFLEAPSATNPIAPLNGFWKAAPGAYVPPFDAFGLDPTSTNLTLANPIPVATGVETYPVIMTLPNAASNREKPDTGWPIVIFQHGITRNRTDMLAIADAMASVGYAVIAQDLPLHGIVDPTSPFYNSGFLNPAARERTFDLDLDQDGVIDSSGSYTINLQNLLVSRDNFRQGVADLFSLSATIPTIDLDGDSNPDFDGSRIGFVSQSLGSMVGITFLALEDTVKTAVLSVPGGGIARLLDASPTFGPTIRAGLSAAGVEAGTPAYDQFMVITQTVVDSGDPLNYGAFTSLTNSVLVHEVIGDLVIPNSVPTAPLSGTEPLMAEMGLTIISDTVSVANGLDVGVRFIAGDHGSLLNPAASVAATVEMQSQMVSMISSQGTFVLVADDSVLEIQ